MWEYSALFDMPGPTALETAMRDPEWWKREGCDLRVGQMAYRTTTTLAGDTLVAEIYPAWGREKKTTARKARHNLTPERIKKYNEQRARFRLELLMDANFTAEDLNMTLTYTDAPTEAEARKDVKNYIATSLLDYYGDKTLTCGTNYNQVGYKCYKSDLDEKSGFFFSSCFLPLLPSAIL